MKLLENKYVASFSKEFKLLNTYSVTQEVGMVVAIQETLGRNLWDKENLDESGFFSFFFSRSPWQC